jgi:hypothetical protein
MSATAVLAREAARGGGSDGERNTPDALRMLLAVLVVLSLVWGAVAALTADQHASAASDVVAVSEPLSLDAEQIYQSLSDADATAANAFLAGGLEPAAARKRYQADLSAAAVRIEAASAMVGSGAARMTVPSRPIGPGGRGGRAAPPTATGDDLATLSADLSLYAGDVERARADNRLGLPLGAAYLREASGLLRDQMLPAASDIYAIENTQLTTASAQATGLPLMVIAILIGLAIGYVLLRTMRWLTRHTHRLLNPGLVIAFAAAVVSLVWLASAFVIGRGDLLHAQQYGSGPVEAFARADVAALQAHADESLTLIDNSGDDSYQADFRTQQKLLGPGTGTLLAAVTAAPVAAGAPGQAAAADAQAWYKAHAALRAQDNAGAHAAAVNSALSGDSAARFGALSATLESGITTHQAVFASSARSGRDAFTGLEIGMIVASLVMAACCAWGLTRRLAEYR